MRGLAILAVIALHSGVLSWGWAGVDLFFALSGFLITGILLDAKAAGGQGWANYGRPFYARRALRILPLAYVTMAAAFIVAPAIHRLPPTSLKEQAWYWLYISNWWIWPRADSGWQLSHFWSLAVEEQFYLCWPWIVLALSRERLAKLALLLLLLSPLLRLAVLLAPVPPQVGHSYETLTFVRLDGLAAGAFVAVLARSPGGLARWTRQIYTILAVGVVSFAAVWYSAAEHLSYVFRYSTASWAAGAFVAASLTLRSGLPLFVLRHRWLRWVGKTSYATYIIHPFVGDKLADRWSMSPTAHLIATLSVTLLLSALSWAVLEHPILSLKRRFPMPGGREDYPPAAIRQTAAA